MYVKAGMHYITTFARYLGENYRALYSAPPIKRFIDLEKEAYKIDRRGRHVIFDDAVSYHLERFIARVHKYFDLQELTPEILNDYGKMGVCSRAVNG